MATIQKQRISRMSCMRRCLSLVTGLAVLLLTPGLTAHADNTEDLLNVYGLTLGGPIKSELEKEMEALEKDLLSMQTQQNIEEEYNATLSEYIEKCEQFMGSILDDVYAYQRKNDNIANQIGSNLLDASIDSLLKLDAQYKTNESYMDDLLSAMNSYQIDYAYKTIGISTSDVESRLTEVQSLYIDSLDTFDLGKVSGIDFVMPVNKIVNSDYGYRIDPIVRDSVRFHAGTDYRATEGTPIYALFNGTVISSGWSNTIGNFVTVQSGDNIKYLICHCSRLAVEDGQVVNQGDVIGYVGGTGTRCTGPHLHLALYLNGVSYDVDRLFR